MGFWGLDFRVCGLEYPGGVEDLEVDARVAFDFLVLRVCEGEEIE